MDTLYKYYPPDTGLKVLNNRTIRFSPIAEFNDPFELRTFSRRTFNQEEFGYELYTQMVEVLENDEELKLEKNIQPQLNVVDPNLLRELIHHIKELDKPFDEKHEMIIDAAVLIAKKTIKDSPSEWEKVVRGRLAKYIGALCLCEVRDSLLMWAHYAQDHTGVLFGLDVNKLPTEHIALTKMNYVTEFPLSDLKSTVSSFLGRTTSNNIEATIKNWFLTKSAEWEYEQEWRLVSNSNISENNHLYTYENKLIKEVYLGCRMSEQLKEDFTKLALELNSEIKIYEVSLSDVAYKLEFERRRSAL